MLEQFQIQYMNYVNYSNYSNCQFLVVTPYCATLLLVAHWLIELRYRVPP
jgi:hypothetical protein